MVILLSVSTRTSYGVTPKRIVIICICLIEHSRAGFE